jgi:hypothetical protein
MSNIGLNSNIYHSTRSYLDLLNNYLIDFNYAREMGRTYTNDKVVNFFQRVGDKSKVDPEVQLLRSFFNRFYKEKHKSTEKELSTLAEKVENADLDNQSIKEIEALVDVLKYHCAQSYARMKGNR